MGINTEKHTFYVLEGPSPRRHGFRTDYTVLFMHKDRKGLRAKAGILSVPFVERYGISVFATYDGSSFWSQSGSDLDLMQALQALYNGAPPNLPILSQETINEGRTW